MKSASKPTHLIRWHYIGQCQHGDRQRIT